MTPHEHYLEAERLLGLAEREFDRTPNRANERVRRAHVHAVLATAPRPPRYRELPDARGTTDDPLDRDEETT